jgi:hypothetical protein
MSESTNLSTLELQKQFYSQLCTPSEIERVFNPQDAKDFLLALRSHYIVDNMRIYRFFLRAMWAQGEGYSLERNFETDHYHRYLELLSLEDREKLSSVTFGDVFTKEVNGQIFSSPFGRIVTISRSLKYFLEYSHLALKQFSSDIPADVRFAALIIALRVMFEYEALDFEVDPRGKLSQELAMEMRRPIPEQLQFVVGHEFAHHLLGHLSDSRVHDSALYATKNTSSEVLPARTYSTSQEQEFSADVTALMSPQMSDAARASFLNSTLIWFAALELYQHARNVIMPLPAWKTNSHPTARERHLHLLAEVETRYSKEMQEVSQSIILAVDSLKQPLSEYLSLQIESFETYGSIYLGAPNTKWHGPKLIDRKDYY